MDKKNKEIECAGKQASKAIEALNDMADIKVEEKHSSTDKKIKDGMKKTPVTTPAKSAAVEAIKSDITSLQETVSGLIKSQKETSDKTKAAIDETKTVKSQVAAQQEKETKKEEVKQKGKNCD